MLHEYISLNDDIGRLIYCKHCYIGQQEESTTGLLSPGTCYDIGDIASGKIPLAALTREH